MGLLRLLFEEINIAGLVARLVAGVVLGVFLGFVCLADELKVIMLLRIGNFGWN